MTELEKIRKLREEGLSLFTAKRIVKGERLLFEVTTATSISDLRSVLIEILDDLYPKRPKL